MPSRIYHQIGESNCYSCNSHSPIDAIRDLAEGGHTIRQIVSTSKTWAGEPVFPIIVVDPKSKPAGTDDCK